MANPIRDVERRAFVDKFGCPPIEVAVAVDALAVFVHQDNPIASLTLEQADAIFSKARRRGGPEVRTWGDLGLTGEWAEQAVRLHGRNPASGSYGFFRTQVLQNGEFKDDVRQQPGSASIVKALIDDRFAIGYAGPGYRVDGVRVVPLAPQTGEAAAGPSDDSYPLMRMLRIVINRPPGQACDPRVREFLRFALSKEGQTIVVKDGYLPLTAAQAAEERKKLD